MMSSVKFLENAMERLTKEGNLRDLGKLWGDANEDVQCDWIAKNTCFTARPRSDFDNDKFLIYVLLYNKLISCG